MLERTIHLEVSELFAVLATRLVLNWWKLGVARIGDPMDRQLLAFMAVLCVAALPAISFHMRREKHAH
jgi:hypothetical protein